MVLKSIKFINIHFSNSLEKAIEQKLIEKQNIRATQIEGQINYINKQTEGLIRISKREIQAINQARISNFENTKINVHAACLDSIIKADADGYAALNNNLLLNADNNLLNFIYVFEGRDFKGKQVINFPNFAVIDKK